MANWPTLRTPPEQRPRELAGAYCTHRKGVQVMVSRHLVLRRDDEHLPVLPMPTVAPMTDVAVTRALLAAPPLIDTYRCRREAFVTGFQDVTAMSGVFTSFEDWQIGFFLLPENQWLLEDYEVVGRPTSLWTYEAWSTEDLQTARLDLPGPNIPILGLYQGEKLCGAMVPDWVVVEEIV